MLARKVSREAAIAWYRGLPEARVGARVGHEVAKLLVGDGRHGEAREEAVRALARFPADRALLRFVLLVAGDAPEAREALAAYRRAAGEDAGYHEGAGLLALARGEPAAALASFERALAAAPGDPHVRAGAARALGRLRREAEEGGDCALAALLEESAAAYEPGR
jgi:tetratricopeptide (TPR) repeat protein